VTLSPATISVTMTINGQSYTVDVRPHHTLLDVLRDQLGLTGSKECCAEGECGACTVLIDGRAITACLMLGVEADGSDIVTIEGLAKDRQLDRVQQAFLDKGAVQCGFCIPGMIVAARYLLTTNPHPTMEEIKEGLAGNLCRCGGYSRIVEAVAAAADPDRACPERAQRVEG
jgi:aerobic carbon-monoxide dehydrogenase small subunit